MSIGPDQQHHARHPGGGAGGTLCTALHLPPACREAHGGLHGGLRLLRCRFQVCLPLGSRTQALCLSVWTMSYLDALRGAVTRGV